LNAPPLVVREVSKAYGRRPVLQAVSFEARAGEILGIVGENGAGKSTLLRIIVGLLRSDAGDVRANGRLGYCDQEPQLFPDLSIAEHFAYFARAYGLADGGGWLERRDELLERFNFNQYTDSRVTAVSGGTRQKLHLSLALLHHPDILILDEPYLAFDWDTYLRFWAYAEALRNEGAAIVIVSHLAHDRDRFTRILELQDGGIRCG